MPQEHIENIQNNFFIVVGLIKMMFSALERFWINFSFAWIRGWTEKFVFWKHLPAEFHPKSLLAHASLNPGAPCLYLAAGGACWCGEENRPHHAEGWRLKSAFARPLLMLFDGEQRSAPTPAAFQTSPPKITPGLRKYYCLVIGRAEPGGEEGRGGGN